MGASTYDDIAEWYDEYVEAGPLEDDPFYSSVERLIGPVAGLHVCELACGQGRVARRLSSLGARVVGIDLSARLLAIARQREHELTIGAAYVRDDAQGLRGIQSNSFDGVVCHMALMDIPDLAATIAAVCQVLRPGGWFVFSIFIRAIRPRRTASCARQRANVSHGERLLRGGVLALSFTSRASWQGRLLSSNARQVLQHPDWLRHDAGAAG